MSAANARRPDRAGAGATIERQPLSERPPIVAASADDAPLLLEAATEVRELAAEIRDVVDGLAASADERIAGQVEQARRRLEDRAELRALFAGRRAVGLRARHRRRLGGG